MAPRVRPTALSAVLLALLLPAPAAHATSPSTVVEVDIADVAGPVTGLQALRLTGYTVGQNTLVVTRLAGDEVRLTLTGGGALEISGDAAPLCAGSATAVVCGGAPYQELSVDFHSLGGDGDDDVTLDGALVRGGTHAYRGRVRVLLGDGDDRYDGRTLPAETPSALFDYGLIDGLTTGAGGIEGGDGDDELLGGPVGEWIAGGAGDDTLRGGGGDDRLEGHGGSDRFVAEPLHDGADAVFGDGETITEAAPEGDHVDYSARTGAVTVNLPALGGGASTGNGGASENDRLEGVESVTGGAGGDTLTGNEGPNVLIGGAGGDLLTGHGGDDRLDGGFGEDGLSGGDGDDIVRSRRDAYDATNDPDDAVDCGGGGADVAARDAGDVALGCETDVPGFAGTAAVAGTPAIGNTLGFAATTFGAPADPAVSWYACVPGGSCGKVGLGPSLALTAAHAGHTIYAVASLATTIRGMQFSDFVTTPQTAAVPYPAVEELPPAAPPVSQPPPPAPPALSFADRARRAADRAFGGPAQVVAIPKLGGSQLLFESPIIAKKRFAIDPKATGTTSLLVAACEAACVVTADLTFTLPPAATAGKPAKKAGTTTSKKAKKATSRKLGRTKFRLGAGQAGVLKLKLRKSERNALKTIKQGTLKVTLGYKSGGAKKATKTTRTYGVRALKAGKSKRATRR